MRNKILIKNILFQLFSFFISALGGIFIIPIIINKLGSVSYGLYEFILAYWGLNFIIELGIGNTILNYTNQYLKNNNYKTFFNTILFYKTIFTIVFAVIFAFIFYFNIKTKYDFTGYNIIYLTILVSISILTFQINSLFDQFLKGLNRFDLAAITNLISVVLSYCLIYTFYLAKTKLTVYDIILSLLVIGPLFRFLFNYYLIKRLSSIGINQSYIDNEVIKTIWVYLKNNSVITLMGNINNKGVVFIFSLISNPLFIGVYGLIQKIKSPINQIQELALRPLLTHSKNNKNHSKLIYNYTILLSSAIILLVSLIYLNINFILEMWINKEYTIYSKYIVLSLFPFLLPNIGTMLMIYYGEGKTKLNIQLTSYLAFVSIIFSLFGALFFNFYGFIIMNLLANIAINQFYVFKFLTYYKISYKLFYINIYLKIYFICLVCLAFVYIFHHFYSFENLRRIFFTNIIFILTFLCLSYLSFKKNMLNE